MPRKIAWLLFAAAAALLFLATLKEAGTATGLPDWLDRAGLCALAVGCVAWAMPQAPAGGGPVP